MSFVEMSEAKQFSYEDQIRYATFSEKMVGHLIASLDAKGYPVHGDELALMHLTHPFEEEFDSMSVFYEDLPEFKNKSQYILYIISNSNNPLDQKPITEQISDTLSLVKQGQKLVLDKELMSDRFFRLLLINSLLEETKMELIDSDNSKGLGKIMERQDAFGFAVRADMILKDTKHMDEETFQASQDHFIEFFNAFGERQSSKNLIKILDDIIINQYQHILQERPVFTYKGNGGSVQNERLVSLEQDVYNGKTLVTFVGKNFPEDSALELTFATSDTNESTLSVHTSSNGSFFIPVGFIHDDLTYYLNVKCGDKTTTHILSTNI